MSEKTKHHWRVMALDPPALSGRLWPLANLVGLIFLIAALLQLISFNDFENNLAAGGIGWVQLVAALLVLFELWAAAGFFKLKLSRLFRDCANFFALVICGFWFFVSVRQVSDGANASYSINGQTLKLSANFFGRFLNQTPGWWTVIEVSIFFWLVIFLLSKMRPARLK